MQEDVKDEPRPCLHYSYDGLHLGGYMREMPKIVKSRRWIRSMVIKAADTNTLK